MRSCHIHVLCSEYGLGVPTLLQWGGSVGCPVSMFLSRSKIKNVYSINPTFPYIVGFSGTIDTRKCCHEGLYCCCFWCRYTSYCFRKSFYTVHTVTLRHTSFNGKSERIAPNENQSLEHDYTYRNKIIVTGFFFSFFFFFFFFFTRMVFLNLPFRKSAMWYSCS